MGSGVPETWERRRDVGPGERDAQRLDVVGRNTDRVGDGTDNTGDTAAAIGLSLEISFGVDRATMVGVVLEPGRRAVGLVESELRVPKATPNKPRSSRHWEVRGHGLWADHVVEQPLVHWSCGLEAFALAVDEPDELVRTGIGHRVPLGWELEFEAGGEAIELGAASSSGREVEGFRQMGRVHGIVMDERGEWPFEGLGLRTRWWGATSPSFVGASPPTWEETPAPGAALDLVVDGVRWNYRLDDGNLVVRNDA